MAKKKPHGNENRPHSLKDGLSKNRNPQKALQRAGINWDEIKPKMEEYESLIDWNKDSIAYMTARQKAMKEYLELYALLGNKGVDYGMEIARISHMLDVFERQLLEDGINPLSDKQYLQALKHKKDLMIEFSKLNVDIEKAKVDYIDKKSRNPKFEEYEMTVQQDYGDEDEDN